MRFDSKRLSPAGPRGQSLWPWLLVALSLIGSASSAFAETSSWHYRGTLYGWASSMDGRLQVDPLPVVAVSRGFTDAWSSVDFAAMGVIEARGERWGLWFDLQALNLSNSGRVPMLGLPGAVDIETRGALAMLSYRWLDGETAYLDVLAGARYWSLDAQARLSLAPGVPLPMQAGTSPSLLRPQLGLKGTWSFARPWFVTGWVQAGHDSGTRWSSDAMLSLGYDFNSRLAVLAGYRSLAIKHRGGRLDIDARFHGPGLALDWRF